MKPENKPREIEVTVTVRNNILKQSRTEMGLCQSDMAKAIGIPLCVYAGLETMRKSPLRAGEWTEGAKAIASFLAMDVEEVFPESILGINKPSVSRRIDANQLYPLLSAYQERSCRSPEDLLLERQEREEIRASMGEIGARHRYVLEKRFGLDDSDEMTNHQLAEDLEVSDTRASQVQRNALNDLRYQIKLSSYRFPGLSSSESSPRDP